MKEKQTFTITRDNKIDYLATYGPLIRRKIVDGIFSAVESIDRARGL